MVIFCIVLGFMSGFMDVFVWRLRYCESKVRVFLGLWGIKGYDNVILIRRFFKE